MKILIDTLTLSLRFDTIRLPSVIVKLVEIGLFESITKQCKCVTESLVRYDSICCVAQEQNNSFKNTSFLAKGPG